MGSVVVDSVVVGSVVVGSVVVGSVGAAVATVDWGEVSVGGDGSSFFGYSSVRLWMKVEPRRLLKDPGCIGGMNGRAHLPPLDA